MERSMKIGFYDGLTGQQIEREATAEEIAEREAEIAITVADDAAKKQIAEESRATIISAYQKLGLTQAEINALIPPIED
jgi:hypothetical protein